MAEKMNPSKIGEAHKIARGCVKKTYKGCEEFLPKLFITSQNLLRYFRYA